MIAVYIRVSTQRQKLQGQRAEIKRWLKAHNHTDVRWFEDKESATSKDRSALAELEKAIFRGEVSTVVVWKLDRLARSIRDGIEIIGRWCDQGVRLVAVTQEIDLQGVTGKMIASVLFGVAEMELELRRERQAAGITEAKKRGVYQGRKPGATKAKPEQAIALRTKGLTFPEIAKVLGVSERTAKRYLSH